MKITEVIEIIKKYHKGIVDNKPIDSATSRDQILYGNPDQECTGIVTTCQANIDVIKRAIEEGANLIISHESLFWNHGDHVEWLVKDGNKIFKEKRNLMDEHNIVVWRDHDYIHSGIPIEDKQQVTYADGIFYGIAQQLGWTQYMVNDSRWQLAFNIPEMSVEELSNYLIEKNGLRGVRIIGNKELRVSKIRVPFHIMGEAKEYICMADRGDADCFLTMELVDYTLAEYIRDSSFTSYPKAAICMGHFNLEEPGMEYFAKCLDNIFVRENIACKFIQSGDMYHYITI